MNTCLDCGRYYEYDPNKPLGASSERCSTCRKRQTILNNKKHLLDISSGTNQPKCYRCGYRNPVALVLIDGVAPLKKPSNKIEMEEQAKKQFILCMNCDAELKHNIIEVKVVDSKQTPIRVEVYECMVQIVKKQIETSIKYPDDEETKFEIDTGAGGNFAEARKPKTKLIGM